MIIMDLICQISRQLIILSVKKHKMVEKMAVRIP